jgi:hypothetical protein
MVETVMARKTDFNCLTPNTGQPLSKQVKRPVLTKKLFKIDTKTGATWMLIDVMLEGRDRKYWKKIKEKTN